MAWIDAARLRLSSNACGAVFTSSSLLSCGYLTVQCLNWQQAKQSSHTDQARKNARNIWLIVTFSANASTKGLLMTLQEEDTVIKGIVLRIAMMVSDAAGSSEDRAWMLDEISQRLLDEADKARGYVK